MDTSERARLIAALIAGWPTLLGIKGTCRFLGGDRPLNAATVYRAIKSGVLPPPISVGAGAAGQGASMRFVTSELAAAVIDRANLPRVKPKPPGRPRKHPPAASARRPSAAE